MYGGCEFVTSYHIFVTCLSPFDGDLNGGWFYLRKPEAGNARLECAAGDDGWFYRCLLSKG